MIGAALEALFVLTSPVWTLGPVIVVTAVVRRLADRRAARRPQAGDKPVQIASTPDYVVTLADVVADLTAGGSTVAAEFLPPADRVDQRAIATTGVLLLPDDVDLPPGLTTGAVVLRTSHPEAVRVEHGSRLQRATKAALAREAARVRRDAYDQLLRDRRGRRAAAVPEPTVGPAGPSGVSSSWRPGTHGSVDVRAAVPVQADVPRPPPRPSPGHASRH